MALPDSAPPRLDVDPLVFEVGCLCTGYVAAWMVVQGAGALMPGLLSGGALYILGPVQVGLAAAAYAGLVAVSGPRLPGLPVRPRATESGPGGAQEATAQEAAADDGARAPRAAPVPASLGLWLVHVLAAVAGSVVLGWLLEALGAPVHEQAGVLELVGDGTLTTPLVMLMVGAVVLAPMAEEWAYRGLLFRRLWHRVGPWVAWCAPALLFAGSHFNPSGLLIYAWLGLVFANAYRMTGRIGVAVGVHAANNALTLAYLMVSASMGLTP